MKNVVFVDTSFTVEFSLVNYTNSCVWCSEYESSSKYACGVPFSDIDGGINARIYFELEEDAIMCKMSN